MAELLAPWQFLFSFGSFFLLLLQGGRRAQERRWASVSVASVASPSAALRRATRLPAPSRGRRSASAFRLPPESFRGGTCSVFFIFFHFGLSVSLISFFFLGEYRLSPPKKTSKTIVDQSAAVFFGQPTNGPRVPVISKVPK